MSNVLLIIQLIISVVLTGLILVQRSEGGALGIGGGGGGIMSGRSATTSIARLTAILGTIFIINCIALTIVFNNENADQSLFDDTNAVAPVDLSLDSPDTTPPLVDIENPIEAIESVEPEADDEE